MYTLPVTMEFLHWSTSRCLRLVILLAFASTGWSFIVMAPSVFLSGNKETILVVNPRKTSLQGELVLESNPHIATDPQYEPQRLTLRPGEFRVVKFQLYRNFTPHIDLKMTFDGQTKVRTFRMSHRAGHIFVRTDKPVYNPKEKSVHVRFIALDEEIRPADRIYRLQIKNPNGRLMISRDFHNATESMFVFEYLFPEDPELGEWTASVLYGNDLRQKQDAKFELIEYVLPTFRVDVEMTDTLLPSMNSVPVKVTATHVYGKPVKGQVMVKEFVQAAMGDRLQQQGLSNWTVLDENGEAEVRVDLTKYQHNRGWRPVVQGKRLLIEASVLEPSSGKTETGSTDRAIFEKNWFKVSIGQMQKGIRPGYPALITVRVRHANGRLAADVPVYLKAFDDDERQIPGAPSRPQRTDAYGVASFLVPTQPTYRQIRVRLEVGPYRQTTVVSTVLEAHKDSYFVALKKVPPEMMFRTGQTFPVEVYFRPEAAFVGGLVAIVAAGKVLEVKEVFTAKPHVVSFTVVPEMSPIARVLAMGWTSAGNVSMDSYVITTKADCRSAEYTAQCTVDPKPGGHGTVEIFDAMPQTIVGLSIVDEAVYAVRSATIFTKDYIFQELKKADRGCGDGGGIDLEESSVTAGVIVITDSVTISDNKNCQQVLLERRTRRSLQLDARQNDTLATKCCRLAYTNYHATKSCEERSESLIEEFHSGERLREKCQRHFLGCCRDTPGVQLYRVAVLGPLAETDLRARDNDASFFIDEEPIPQSTVRKDFRESFLFRDIEVNEEGMASVDLTLPHSITHWSVETISVNRRGGICASDPIRLPALKDFFLQLDLPYKVVRNEHVQIKVTLYNYDAQDITGNLYLYGVDGVCTEAAAGQRSDKTPFRISGHSSFRVAFPVFPTREGSFPIRVEAITPEGRDSVEKELYVVPEGREIRKSYSVALDPTNSQRRRARSITCGPSCRSQIDPSRHNQTITIDTSLPTDVIEGTGHLTLSVIGEKMGPAMFTALDNIDGMLILPKGCGEQNMMRLAPLVFITEFRKTIGQLDRPTETRAKDHIMMAYNRQMTFQKQDGSFGAFRNRGSSVWLTAFVAKVFCRVSPMFSDPATFPAASEAAVNWLIRRQRSDGSFQETKPILHKALLGGVKGRTALTAFIALALEECSHHVNENNREQWKSVLNRAKDYLAANIDKTTEGYTAALVAYALSDTSMSQPALANLRNHLVLNQEVNTLSITQDDNAPRTIEGNGYALLATTKTRYRNMSLPLSNWLIAQQSATGGFQSTQDTVVALQALSEYFAANRDLHVDLSVLVSHGKHFKRDLRVANESATMLQTMSTNELGDKMFVQATGSGTGLLSVLIRYNTIIPPAERCMFNVTLDSFREDALALDEQAGLDEITYDEYAAITRLDELIEANQPTELRRQRQRQRRDRRSAQQRPDQLVYRLRVCVLLLADTATSMSVVQVDMITGYAALKHDLVALSNAHTIDRFELLPDRVNLYVSEFGPRKRVCFEFRVVQEFTVSNAQPATVSVYDYYSKGGNCPIFYELRSFRTVLVDCASKRDKLCTCVQNTCPPREPFEPRVKSSLITVNPGRDVATRIMCRHDFMFVGTVVDCASHHRTTYCRTKVERRLYARVELADVLTFTVSEHCKAVLAVGFKYLIFGHDRLPNLDSQGNLSHNYTLSSKSIIYMLKNSSIDLNIAGNFEFVSRTRSCPK